MKPITNPFKTTIILSVGLIFIFFSSLASARDEVCVYDQEDYRGCLLYTSDAADE